MSDQGGDDAGRDNRLLATLQQLLRIRELRLGPALNEAADLVNRALGADKVDAFIYQRPIESLVAIGTSDTPMGRRQHELGLDRLPLANGGRAVVVYRDGGCFITGRSDQDPEELRGIVEGLGVRSTIMCPIHVVGARRGVLSATSAKPDLFGEQDLRYLETVADWLGVVAHRAELIERGAQEAQRRGRQAAVEELARLTRRQQEIASLVAEGLTNDEIAYRLTITAGTAANHLEAILRRLGLRSRTQLAVWAVEHGLYRSGAESEEPDEA
jgi:two-component system, OmpR family, sensor kinase